MAGTNKSSSRKPPTRQTRCEDFVDRTTLNSPKPVVSSLKQGDLLGVKLQPVKGGGSTVVALTKDKEIVGAITSAKTPQLIKCLEEGHKFEAEVLELAGGQCTVEVHHA